MQTRSTVKLSSLTYPTVSHNIHETFPTRFYLDIFHCLLPKSPARTTLCLHGWGQWDWQSDVLSYWPGEWWHTFSVHFKGTVVGSIHIFSFSTGGSQVIRQIIQVVKYFKGSCKERNRTFFFSQKILQIDATQQGTNLPNFLNWPELLTLLPHTASAFAFIATLQVLSPHCGLLISNLCSFSRIFQFFNPFIPELVFFFKETNVMWTLKTNNTG